MWKCLRICFTSIFCIRREENEEWCNTLCCWCSSRPQYQHIPTIFDWPFSEICRNNDNIHLLLDGHNSHAVVDINERAQQHHIIIHLLPAHTSNILQPSDVGCNGPLQRIYDHECHKTKRQNSSVIIRYNICELSCKAYQKALSPENIQSAFMKTRIYPLDKSVIKKDQLKPSEVFTAIAECRDYGWTKNRWYKSSWSWYKWKSNGSCWKCCDWFISFWRFARSWCFCSTLLCRKNKQTKEN